MGYTHYWNVPRHLTPDEFSAVAQDIKTIVTASGVPIAGWNGDGKPEYGEEGRIALNGAGPAGCESFVITPTRTGFDFCKTRFQPYDVVVTASLLALKDRVPEARLSSDGEGADWVDGHALAERALGRKLEPFSEYEEVVEL